MSYFLLTLLMLVGLFLMAVILLQRGRGGGLAGAFGGLGGQSAFGTRAGDTFTWITVVTVLVWVVLAALTGRSMRSDQSFFSGREADEIEISPDKANSKGDGKSGTAPAGDDDPLKDLIPEGADAGSNEKSSGEPTDAAEATTGEKDGPATSGLTAPPDDTAADSGTAADSDDPSEN